MKLKKRILFNLILVVMLLLIPLNTFAYSKYLIPGGENIGIQVNNKYITVVGFYEVDNKYITFGIHHS